MRKYFRSFLMFNQEDPGFSENGQPAGYIKTEVKDGKGKLTVFVQNLKDSSDNMHYRAYLLKCSENGAISVDLGLLEVRGNKGELQKNFDPDNVLGTGISIEEINTALIAVENKNNGANFSYPLSAYRDKKFDLRRYLSSNAGDKPLVDYGFAESETEEREDAGELLEKQDVFSKYTGSIESKYIKREKILADANDEAKPGILSPEGEIKSPEEEIEATIESKDSTENKTDAGIRRVASKPGNSPGDAVKSRDERINSEDLVDKVSGTSSGLNTVSDATEMKPNPYLSGINFHQGFRCPYLINNTCMSRRFESAQSSRSCEGCGAVKPGEESNRENKPVDLDKLREEFDKYFEKTIPFGNRKSNYTWWKVNSPVYLNNILYQKNIKTPLLFNPSVMMAHFKYRHLIIGIYSDKTRQKEYIVGGVPGVYSIDERPFGELCRWVQLEGYEPRYGAFGYWLIYIDPRTGKLLRVN